MTWTPLHAQLHQTLRQRTLLPARERLLVAVSGGQDSLCLLALLKDLQPRWHWHLAIGHCDHRWATDVGLAAHVAEIARQFQVPFHLKTAAEPIAATEAAARQWRYQALTELAVAADCPHVVVAHTQTDRAETLLYNLIRGTGTDGLQALAWERLLLGDVRLVRPLLNISRARTGEFCQQRQLPVWEDAVNADLRFARNRLRAEVFPYLRTHFNPQVEAALAQTAEILQAEVACLGDLSYELATAAIAPLPSEVRGYRDEQLDRQTLRAAPIALQRRTLRIFLQRHGQRTPTFSQIEQLVTLIDAPNGSRTSSLAAIGGAYAEVVGDWIRLQAKPHKP
ncbi:MAG: tRNA lysidine(34) synthetase TilS [Cyanobacteria bacterium J06641_5]